MADLGDVADALVLLCQTALYPNGTGAGSPIGINFRIYRGAPTANTLDADLRAGYTMVGGKLTLTTPSAQLSHITVDGRPGVGRVRPPYVFAPATATNSPVTVTAAVDGDTVTLGGTVTAGQGMAVLANGTGFGATAGASDTLATLAAAVAANIGSGASASGPVITVPGALALFANGFALQTVSTEVQRQIQGFEIDILTSSRALRDATSKALFASLGATYTFDTPDGFECLLRMAPPIRIDDDKPEKELLFIAKTYWQVEFPTIATSQAATEAIVSDTIETFAGDPLATIVEA